MTAGEKNRKKRDVNGTRWTDALQHLLPPIVRAADTGLPLDTEGSEHPLLLPELARCCCSRPRPFLHPVFAHQRLTTHDHQRILTTQRHSVRDLRGRGTVLWRVSHAPGYPRTRHSSAPSRARETARSKDAVAGPSTPNEARVLLHGVCPSSLSRRNSLRNTPSLDSL